MYALVITFRLQSSAKNRHEILALKSWDQVWDEVWDEHLYFAVPFVFSHFSKLSSLYFSFYKRVCI